MLVIQAGSERAGGPAYAGGGKSAAPPRASLVQRNC